MKLKLSSWIPVLYYQQHIQLSIQIGELELAGPVVRPPPQPVVNVKLDSSMEIDPEE